MVDMQYNGLLTLFDTFLEKETAFHRRRLEDRSRLRVRALILAIRVAKSRNESVAVLQIRNILTNSLL